MFRPSPSERGESNFSAANDARFQVVEEQANVRAKNIQSHVDRIKIGDGMLENMTTVHLLAKHISKLCNATFDKVSGRVSNCILEEISLTGRRGVDDYCYAPTLFDQVGPDSPSS